MSKSASMKSGLCSDSSASEVASTNTVVLAKKKRVQTALEAAFISAKSLTSINFRAPYSDDQYSNFQLYRKSATNLSIMYSCIKPVLVVAFITISCLYTIPLLPPEEAPFFKSTVSQLMSFIVPSCCAGSFLWILKHFFPEAPISKWLYLRLSCIGGLAFFTSLAFLTQFCWPFPMSTVVPVSFSLPIMLVATYITVIRRINHLPHYIPHLIAYFKICICMWSLLFIYPLITKLHRDGSIYFHKDVEIFQLGIATLLFAIRRAAKKFVIHVCEGVKPFVPAPFLAVLGIDAFHVVYISTILVQKGLEWYSIAFIMILDTGSNIFELKKLYKMRCKFTDTDYLWILDARKSLASRVRAQKEMLYYCENLVLLEYVECIVPSIIAIFNVFLFYHDVNLPFFDNYKHLVSYEALLDTQKSLWSYAFLELGILFVVYCINAIYIKTSQKKYERKVQIVKDFAPFWEILGFTLQSKMIPTMSILTCWVLFSNCAAMVHMGSDFKLICKPPPLS